jgi:SAM-dependent methyltransferase
MDDDRSLADDWDGVADQWAVWARTPAHDSYWRFHRAAFFDLLPPPGRLTLDIGCGEGRVARDLKALGHNVVALDASPRLVDYAKAADPAMKVLVADAAHLPFGEGAADLAVAFMSLHDVDDMAAAVREIARVLDAGGVLCAAIVHPINSAGQFEGPAPDARFVIEGSYMEPHRYRDAIERSGLPMTFSSMHRPLQAYTNALASAGFTIDVLREVTVDDTMGSDVIEHLGWRRLPLFLDLRARKR